MQFVRCKLDGAFSDCLTFGKEYELYSVSPDGETVTVRDESGYYAGFPSYYFDLSGDARAFQARTIAIEAEWWAPGEWNELDGNTDVFVKFADGSNWVASVFTYANIATLVRNHQESGESMGGAYFWASDMFLIDRISRARIEEVIAHLLSVGDFETVFSDTGPEWDEEDED